MIDDIDSKIVDILQKDARTSNAEVARRVGMAPSGAFERIKKLEERGVITGYTARVEPRSVGLGLLAFVFVRTEVDALAEQTEQRLADIPEVLEVHHIAGEDCFLLKVRAADPEALGRLLRERIAGTGNIRSTRTTIVLQTVKESTELPSAPTGNGKRP